MPGPALDGRRCGAQYVAVARTRVVWNGCGAVDGQTNGLLLTEPLRMPSTEVLRDNLAPTALPDLHPPVVTPMANHAAVPFRKRVETLISCLEQMCGRSGHTSRSLEGQPSSASASIGGNP